MTQIFIFGSSLAYGVGGEFGGWADLLKQKLQSLMFGSNGVGEKYQLYNFAKPGAPIDFVQKTFKNQIENYKLPGQTIILVSVGGNNSKAEGEPNNFVSNIEKYKGEMSTLLKDMKTNTDHVLFVGSAYIDESKTNPKPNPLTGGKSYFSNARRAEFKAVLQKVCKNLNVEYIDADVSLEEWLQAYLAADGVHPNQKGHEYFFEKIWEKIEQLRKE